MSVDPDRGTGPAIGRMEVFRVALPLAAPVHMSGRTFDVADNVLVRLEADGVEGWGEVTSALATTGEDPDAIEGSLRRFHAARFRPGMSTGELGAVAAVAFRRKHAARSALDIALLDLAARALDRPAWSLLDARARPVLMRRSVIITAADAEGEVEAVGSAWRAGIRAVKLKVGRRPPEEEAAIVRAARALPGVGRDLVIGADANEGMTLERALEFGRLVGTDLDYLEQPLRRADLAGLALLRRGTSVAIVVDESVGGAADVRKLAGAVDGVMLKLQKAGSMRGLVAAARAAGRRGIDVGLTGKVAETGIASAALVHAGAAIGGARWGISLTSGYLAIDPVTPPLDALEGAVVVPPGPGLGVRIDRDALAPYLVRDR